MESKFSNIVDMKAGRVYRETTLPRPADKTKPPWAARIGFRDALSGPKETAKAKAKPKKVRRDKSDLGEHFIAPDGGWAWIVCIAAGISNLSIYPCLQQFGFMFRVRMTGLGLTSSQITTIINTNPAISACTGLLNGPMFRRFTFRQVAMAGSLCIFSGLMLTAFSDSFLSYMVSYALLFGFGMGISVSASSLAINTYFKNKRRRAAGFSWTITGLGPIFLPYLVTSLLAVYGVQGTVLIFAALSLHTMACALIYQPVRFHAPRPEVVATDHEVDGAAGADHRCKYCELQQKKEFGIFSSQYLYQDDDEDKPGYEIIEPGTPMLSRANDGWFGSRLSLASNRNSVRFRTVSSSLDVGSKLNKVSEEEMRKLEEQKEEQPKRVAVAVTEEEEAEFLKPNNFRRERDEVLKRSTSRGNLRLQLGRTDSGQQLRCTCAEEKMLMELTQTQTQTQTQSPTTPTTAAKTLANGGVRPSNNNAGQQLLADDDEGFASEASVTFVQKVVAFFDLDLLRDFTFVNLVAGLTIINFGELNFSILTPFILNDFGFDTSQITLAMSVLAGLDIVVRFLVPFFTEKIPWDNRVFFLIGVVGIALGRTVVACTRSYPLILACFVWIGMCKGIRTIFWPLIIPGYVPLKRLPAASGLQLLISGLFTLGAGPFVGLVRDRFDYSVTLHCLNMMSFIAATSWTTEALVRRYYRRRRRTSVDRTA